MKNNFSLVTRNELIKNINDLPTDTILLIADKIFEPIVKKIKIENKKLIIYTFEANEENKNLNVFADALNFFLKEPLHRQTHLVAWGGGVVSDLGGFVAATLLRGLAWSVVPTTLLSMVDAALGGKVGVNAASGKNLIGAFHAPQNIWVDISFMETLSPLQIQNAKGEILKYCFLSNSIRDLVEKKAPWSDLIKECLLYKQAVVLQDPLEKNIRKFLNFGHTFGHAIEHEKGIEHGLAVALGIKIILEKFNQDYLSNYQQLCQILKLELPNIDIDLAILKRIQNDKKMKQNEMIDLVVLNKLGEPKILSISWKDLCAQF